MSFVKRGDGEKIIAIIKTNEEIKEAEAQAEEVLKEEKIKKDEKVESKE